MKLPKKKKAFKEAVEKGLRDWDELILKEIDNPEDIIDSIYSKESGEEWEKEPDTNIINKEGK